MNVVNRIVSLFSRWAGAAAQGAGGFPHDLRASLGTQTEELRKVARFHKLSVKGAVDVRYQVGEHCTVKVTAPATLLSRVLTLVKDGELRIDLDSSAFSYMPLEVEVIGPSLTGLTMAGACEVKAVGLTGEALRVSKKGAGALELQGNATAVTLEASGAGDIDAVGLRTGHLVVELAGAGEIRAFSREVARASLKGAGLIRIYGRPTQVDIRQTGAGSIEVL